MLGNVTALPTPTCGCSEEISALQAKYDAILALWVEFQAKFDTQQALITSVVNEVQG